MLFKKILDEGNYLGSDTIEILQFNYDGKGGAIAKVEGLLQWMNLEEVRYITWVDDGGFRNYYAPKLERRADIEKLNADAQREHDAWLASKAPKKRKKAA